MRKILAIILIIIFLFSFGCVKKEDGRGKSSDKTFAFTGKNGITVDFEEDSPPKINFVNDQIEIILKLTNRGMVELVAGEIKAKLKGVAATEIFNPSNKETSNDDELLAAELDQTVTMIDMGVITYSPEEMFSAEYKPEIKAEVCFPYTTKINSDKFWISKKQADLNKASISSSDNSDAPVHISNLKEFKGTNKVRFQFIVENVGKGKVVDSCFPEEESDEEIEISILQPIGASCETLDGSSSGTVKLNQGRKIIKCSVGISEEQSYATPIVMELNYNYDLELAKTITIKNL